MGFDVSSLIAPIILLIFCTIFVLLICCFVKLVKNCEETQSPFTNQPGRIYSTVPASVVQQPLVQSTASPTIVPPYPVEPQHPIPHTGGLPPPPPTAGFATNQPPYPTQTPLAMPTPGYYPPPIAPYPPVTSPYPPPSTGPIYPMGSHIGSAPYPPPTTADSTLPPSYQEAVSQTVPPPPVREAYNKQAPYNPNY